MLAMIVQMKLLALSPSCRQSRFSRASSTPDTIGTMAPVANSQHRAGYLQHTKATMVGNTVIICGLSVAARKPRVSGGCSLQPYSFTQSRTILSSSLLSHQVGGQQVPVGPSYLLEELSGKYLLALRHDDAQATTRRNLSITPDTNVRLARCWTKRNSSSSSI